jgi:flagellin
METVNDPNGGTKYYGSVARSYSTQSTSNIGTSGTSKYEENVDYQEIVNGTVAADGGYGDMTEEVYETYEGLQDYLSEVGMYINDVKTNRGTEPLNDADIAKITQAQKAQEAARELYNGYQLTETQKGTYAQLKDRSDGSALWFQTGANSGQGINVGVGSVKTDILGIGNGFGESVIQVDQAPGEAISAYIDIVDDALQYVTAQRAKLGAVQNRMEFTKSSLEISSENLSASESRIRDADMAKEMMKMTAANVLQQAGVSMLAQANQAPQSVLSLLQ